MEVASKRLGILSVRILIFFCVGLLTGVAGDLSSGYCREEESPSLFLCRNNSGFVDRDQLIYLDTTGAPEFQAVECDCTLTLFGTSTVFVGYRSAPVTQCGIEVSLGGETWGCEIDNNGGVTLQASALLSYIKFDDTIGDWSSCLSLRAPFSNLSIECFPWVEYIPPEERTTTPADVDDCASGPCKNGATCTDGFNAFTCNCTAGYEGPTCETDIDDCDSGPCKNGASCTDGINEFTCNCTDGYEGPTCETDIDDCASGPCKNGASCTDGVSEFTCNCTAGYEGPTCETDIDDCASGPCKNGASCTDGVNDFTCNCTAGYEGPTCETDIDDCASGPCKNSASCKDGVNDFTCNCTAGYEGPTCETDIDDCASGPCKNDASCTDGIDAFTCNCTAGYEGPTCETDIDDCDFGPCKNGASCTDGINEFTCNCTAGYEGPTCETDTDDCASGPCKNGASCKDGINEFTCNCTSGFEGPTCEADIDECENDPCKNGANCTNLVNGYTCTCLPGFENDNCSAAIDECTSNPCQNQATCQDGLNSYTCACAPGYEGTDCEIDIDECSESPCRNNGTCTDAVNSFSCSCPRGFEGDTCETDIDECLTNSCPDGFICIDGIGRSTCERGPVAGEVKAAEAGLNWGLIGGVIAGVLLLIILILLVIFFICRRRRDRQPRKTDRSVSYVPSGDVTVTENALYNYDGENPSRAVNALFIGGIPETPGAGNDYIPHFSTDTGERYAVILDSTRSKPKVKERPSLTTFADKTGNKENLKTELLAASYDYRDEGAEKLAQNGDIGFGVHNPGYEHDYLKPMDSRSRTLESEKSDTYDYIDQAKLRIDDEVFEKEKGDYFKIKDGVIDKNNCDSGYNVSSGDNSPLASTSEASVSPNPDGGYMNLKTGDYVNSPREVSPSTMNNPLTPTDDQTFSFGSV